MKVELFYSPGCTKCIASRAQLKAAAEAACGELEWRDLNVIEELDYAVELGVLTLPALAINRQLVFTSLPTPAQLAQAVRQRAIKDA